LIKKTEPILFYLIVIIFATPVFCNDYFVTNDGPAHVYNANLIAHYFGAYHEHITALFNFNTSIEPNWIGHIILILFKLFASGAFSEKLLVAFILLTFPIAVRNLIITLNKENALIAWLSIPFAFNFILGLGFYNFSIGIVILLFAINYSIKKTFVFKGKQLFVLLIFSVLLYFSHLIVYGLFLVFISLGILLKRNESLKMLALFTSFQLPLLLLCFLFLFNHSKGTSADALSFEVLTDWFLKARPLLVYNESLEVWFGYATNIIISFVLISGISLSIFNKKNRLKNTHFLLFLVITLLMLLLFFLAPNELVSGGFLNIRMLLLFYIFLIILLSFFQFNRVLILLPIIILTSIAFYQQLNKFSTIKVLANESKELTCLENYIKEGGTIIPLNYSVNWLHTNLSNYLSSDKLLLLLDNYEANTVHFPLKWVPKAQPNPLLGNFSYSLNPTINIAAYENKTGIQIDYILRWCYQHLPKDSISEKTNLEITKYFKLIYTSPKGNAELFERL